jgi:hypothetical protein
MSDKGSITLHSLFAAVLLLTALAAATLWSTISTTRHKLATAADLTALSAAQSLTQAPPATPIAPTVRAAPNVLSKPDTLTASALTPLPTPCVTAARIAALHKARLSDCDVTSTSVTVQVSMQLDLPLGRPTLTAIARAGPL